MSPELLSVRVASAVLPAYPPSSWPARQPGSPSEGGAPSVRPLARREQSRAGYVAARHLVRQRHRLSHHDRVAVDIRHVADGPERGRPFYCIGSTPGPFSLSISHAEGWAIAALARGTDERVGVDIETVVPRDPAFEAIAFSQDESDRLARLSGAARWRAVARGWVLKEALLKAIGIGLTVPLPAITVDGLECDEGPWAFRPWTGVAVTSRLGCVDVSRVDAAVFEVDDLMGAWVVAPPEARPCPH